MIHALLAREDPAGSLDASGAIQPPLQRGVAHLHQGQIDRGKKRCEQQHHGSRKREPGQGHAGPPFGAKVAAMPIAVSRRSSSACMRSKSAGSRSSNPTA